MAICNILDQYFIKTIYVKKKKLSKSKKEELQTVEKICLTDARLNYSQPY